MLVFLQHLTSTLVVFPEDIGGWPNPRDTGT